MGTITASGSVLARAGTSVSSTLNLGWTPTSEYEKWITEGEAYLSNFVKSDIVTNWASLNAVYKLMLSEHVSSAAAIQAIKFDMSGYTTRIEAERLTQILAWRIQQIEKLLKEDTQNFMGI